LKHPQEQELLQPVFNGTGLSCENLRRDSLWPRHDAQHHDDFTNGSQTELSYDITESPGTKAPLSSYNAPASSPVLGLDDSLEEENDKITSFNEYDAPHSEFHQSMFPEEPWLQPPTDNHHSSTSKHDFFSANSSVSQAAMSFGPEHQCRGQGGEHIQHSLRAVTPAPDRDESMSYDLPQMYGHTTMYNHKETHNPQRTTTGNFSFNPSFASGLRERHLNSVQTPGPSSLPTSLSQYWGVGNTVAINSVPKNDRISHPDKRITSHISTGSDTSHNSTATNTAQHLDKRHISTGSDTFHNWTATNAAQIDRVSHSDKRHVSTGSHNWMATNAAEIAPSEPNVSHQRDVTSSTTGLFNVGHLVPRSTKAIASSVVRKPRHAIPSKALDLGLEGERERGVVLKSNDRILAPTRSTDSLQLEGSVWESKVRETVAEGEIVRSKYFPTSAVAHRSGSSRVISSSRVSAGTSKRPGTSGIDWEDTSASKRASGCDWALNSFLTGRFNNRTVSGSASLGSRASAAVKMQASGNVPEIIP
jgi:hypothetical protein